MNGWEQVGVDLGAGKAKGERVSRRLEKFRTVVGQARFGELKQFVLICYLIFEM